jgi:hypothetical protein
MYTRISKPVKLTTFGGKSKTKKTKDTKKEPVEDKKLKIVNKKTEEVKIPKTVKSKTIVNKKIEEVNPPKDNKLVKAKKSIVLSEAKKKDNMKHNENIIVDDKYRYLLSNHRWSINNGYLRATINKVSHKLHHHIKITLEKEPYEEGDQVRYINKNIYDNRADNLKVYKKGQKRPLQTKQQGTSSDYNGVKKASGKYQVSIQSYGLYASYDNEIHAAWQFNLWLEEDKTIDGIKNDIHEEPKGFVSYKLRGKKDDCPVGIQKCDSGYNVCHYDLKGFTPVYEIALQKLEFFKVWYELISMCKIFETIEIERNSDNHAIISAIENGETKFVILDDKDYLYFKSNDITISISHGYPFIRIDGKAYRLNRFIMNYNGSKLVDHKSREKLDNRKDNLRLASPMQNARNKTKAQEKSSEYMGVSWHIHNKQWESYITIDKEKISLGYFRDVEDAARTRDEYIIDGKLDDFFLLNFPIQ